MDNDVYPLFDALRPSPREVERYSHLIMISERRPPSARADCEREAELQLWATRSLENASGPLARRRKKKADR